MLRTIAIYIALLLYGSSSLASSWIAVDLCQGEADHEHSHHDHEDSDENLHHDSTNFTHHCDVRTIPLAEHVYSTANQISSIDVNAFVIIETNYSPLLVNFSEQIHSRKLLTFKYSERFSHLKQHTVLII